MIGVRPFRPASGAISKDPLAIRRRNANSSARPPSAPDQLRVADFTYVQTAVGTAHAAFVLDTLNQAICQRRPALGALTRHSDRSMQYVSIRYATRLAEAGIDMSAGSVGDSCDSALAETVIGLFKTEVVEHLGPRKTKGRLKWETMKRVH